MDTSPLVIDEISAGAEVIVRMQSYMPVLAAYWLRQSEDAERYLHLVLDGLTIDNRDQAYREILRISGEMKDYYIDPFRVKLVAPDDRAAREVLDMYRRFPHRVPPRLEDRSIGGVPVADMYIYPQPAVRP
jgi:hypothetical protein